VAPTCNEAGTPVSATDETVGGAAVTVSVTGAETTEGVTVDAAAMLVVPAAMAVSRSVVALMDATFELLEVMVQALVLVPSLIVTVQPNWAVCDTCNDADADMPVSVTDWTVGLL
jgi:hypothetical protein